MPYSARSVAARPAELDHRRLGGPVDDRQCPAGERTHRGGVDDRAAAAARPCAGPRTGCRPSPRGGSPPSPGRNLGRSFSSRRRNELEMPALLNMTWSPPNRATAKSTSSWTCIPSATSVRLKAADAPRASASSSPWSTSTSAMTTHAPSSTNSSAAARPIPLDPPVTIATFPVSSWPINSSLPSVCKLLARSAVPPDGTCKHYSLSSVTVAGKVSLSEKSRPTAGIPVVQRLEHREWSSRNRPAVRIAANTTLSYTASGVINPPCLEWL